LLVAQIRARSEEAQWRVNCSARRMLLHVLLVLVVAGVLLWLIESFIPMDSRVLRLLQAVTIIVLVIWLLRVFGIINILPSVRL
jgi:cytochrome c biogenesis protein CcdA